MNPEINILKKLCQDNNIKISASEMELFDKYLSFYLKWNNVYNLSSIRKKEEIIKKHFFDSLTLVKLFEKENIEVNNKEIVDFGSGAGFPGVPLKIYYQNLINLSLIEAVQKKCIFLEMLKKELDLKYEILCKRAETIDKKFDIVVSRATGETFEVLKIGKNLLKKNGYIIIMKAKKIEEELKKFTVKINLVNYPERKFIILRKNGN